jgi:hypothetical protein
MFVTSKCFSRPTAAAVADMQLLLPGLHVCGEVLQ